MAFAVEAFVFMLRSVCFCAGANFAGSFIFLKWVCAVIPFLVRRCCIGLPDVGLLGCLVRVAVVVLVVPCVLASK